MNSMEERSKYLFSLLELERYPVGIKFLFSEEEYNSFNAEELKNKTSYCGFVSKASKGRKLKIHKGHNACSGGAMALGFQDVPEETKYGIKRRKVKTYRDLGVSRKMSRNMMYCEHRIFGTAIMPLKDYEEEPDVVIFICKPYQAMRISQGYAYHYGHADSIKLSGMQAICEECTSYPYENGCFNISMMCSGTRMLSGWKDDEMGIGMPYRIFLNVLDGIIKTVNPLERNKHKKIIKEKLEKNNLTDLLDIRMNENYDDGSYIGGIVKR
ncbi:DUF169 domain-containing protein [Brachyspira alvinipulli]|uniref:DUF169 domain-containing protein n=1 Tax=Brachyspira alvinipulli TaxID=84379 RepID=UPI00047F9E2A|nr:DUF169 domain-containing protein [Brachyspira alvinipulli]